MQDNISTSEGPIIVTVRILLIQINSFRHTWLLNMDIPSSLTGFILANTKLPATTKYPWRLKSKLYKHKYFWLFSSSEFILNSDTYNPLHITFFN